MNLFSRIDRLWLVFVLVILINVPLTPHALAESRCAPLLLMIQGGGWSSSSQHGVSTIDVVKELGGWYKQQGITLFTVSHSAYMESLDIFFATASEAAKTLKKAGFSPVVILGHSLGAQTAANIAQRYSTPLLVTLDGVSFGHPHAHPKGARTWINVWNEIQTWGPDWDWEPYADKNILLPERVEHRDVRTMFRYIEGEVLVYCLTIDLT